MAVGIDIKNVDCQRQCTSVWGGMELVDGSRGLALTAANGALRVCRGMCPGKWHGLKLCWHW